MLSTFVNAGLFFIGLSHGGRPLWEMVLLPVLCVAGVLWLAWDGVTTARQREEEEEEERQHELNLQRIAHGQEPVPLKRESDG
jgi:threonine/homoserine/homoserine lactone efflux protein